MATRYLVRLIEKAGTSQLRHRSLSPQHGEGVSSFTFPTTGLPQTATDADWYTLARADTNSPLPPGRGLHFYEVTSANLDRLFHTGYSWRGRFDLWALEALMGYPKYFPPPQKVGPMGSWCSTTSNTLIVPRLIVASFDDATVENFGNHPSTPHGISERRVASCSVTWCSISDATAEALIAGVETDHAAFLTAVDAGGSYETEYDTLAGYSTIGAPLGSASRYWSAVRDAARTYLESVL